MTDPSVHLPTPPFSHDLLADLHAGVLDADTSAALWPRVHADPPAAAFVHALDRIAVSLSELNAADTEPDPIPRALAEQITSALDRQWNDPDRYTEREPPASSVVALRARRSQWVLGAAAAVVLVFMAIVIGGREQPPAESVAQPGTTSTPTTIESPDNPSRATLLTLVGSDDLGPLHDPARLAGCLRANHISEGAALLGSGELRIDGAPAVVLLFAGSQPRQITALTVGIHCAADNPDTLSLQNIG